MVMIGILPTLAEGHLALDSITPNPRYRLLSEQIMAARGEDISIAISGRERLVTTADSIVPEAACTSTQFHVQTSPDQFAEYWNASQVIAAIQVAVGANSPYLLGKELWRETRIPLFEQATDTRSEELKAQGVRPRVWFGERWITSVFDLFEENVRFFPALLPITEDEDPLEVLEDGRHPDSCRSCGSTTAPSTAGTGRSTTWSTASPTCGWRTAAWGRPDRGRPDRQRGLLLRPGALARRERAAALVADVVLRRRGELPRRRRVRDRRPRSTGPASARSAPPSWCCGGCSRWPTRAWRVGRAEQAEADRLLGIIEQRCLTGTNGAEWFAQRMHDRSDLDRYDALRATLEDYRANMHTNEPVHTWE